MSSATLERTGTPKTQPGGGQGEVTHIILLPEELRGKTTSQAYVLAAMINGTPITALCGYVWVPTRDPSQFPVCYICEEIYKNDPNDHGDRGELPSV